MADLRANVDYVLMWLMLMWTYVLIFALYNFVTWLTVFLRPQLPHTREQFPFYHIFFMKTRISGSKSRKLS